MNGELYDSTIPFGEPELLKASAYERYLRELHADTVPGRTAHLLSQFSPSLQADLWEHEQRSGSYEIVEVIAACIRHSSRVTIYLRCDQRVVPLTLFPRERLVHCPIAMGELLDRYLGTLQVMHLEPATLRPPGDEARELVGEARLHHPMTPLLWAVALHGPRRDLLPEISGPAVYRVSPALDLADAPLSGALRATIERLRHQTVSLSGLAGWPAFDRERAARLLNALYLQAGLIVSRSHPAAVRESWFGL